MKKLKKFTALLLALGMVFGCVTGCGSKEETVDSAETQSTDAAQEEAKLPYEGVELVYWTTANEGTPAAEAISANVADWCEKTGAKVEVTHYGSESEEILGTALSAGEKVDVFEIASAAGLGRNASYALDLTQYVESSDIQDKSYDVFWQEMKNAVSDGKIYGVASIPSYYAFWYNKAIFEECGITKLPKTIEEFEAVCDAIVAKGYAPMALDSAYVGTNFGPHMERFAGQDALSEASMNGNWSGNEDIVAGLQKLIDWVNAGYFAAGAPDEYPNSQNKIGLTEDVAMCYCGTWLPGEIENLTGADLEWGSFLYPYLPDGKGSYSTALSNNCRSINANCENPDAAWDLVYYISTGECDQKYADASGNIPADPNNTPAEVFADAVDVLKNVEKSINWAGGAVDNADMKTAIIDVMTQVYAGKYADGMEAAKAFDALYK